MENRCLKCRWCGSSKTVDLVCVNPVNECYRKDCSDVINCADYYDDYNVDIKQVQKESLFENGI